MTGKGFLSLAVLVVGLTLGGPGPAAAADFGYYASFVPGGGSGSSIDYGDIDVGPDGSIYLLDAWGNESVPKRIVRLSADGLRDPTFEHPSQADVLSTPVSLAVDHHGRAFVLDTELDTRQPDQVHVFGPDGAEVARWPIAARSGATDLAASPAGEVIVIGYNTTVGSFTQRFSPQGELLGSWNTIASAVAVSTNGDVLLASAGGLRRFTPDGDLVYSTSLNPPDQVSIEVADLAVGPNDEIFVLRAERCEPTIGDCPSKASVEERRPDGSLVQDFSCWGSEEGALFDPQALAPHLGRVLITTETTAAVQIFEQNDAPSPCVVDGADHSARQTPQNPHVGLRCRLDACSVSIRARLVATARNGAPVRARFSQALAELAEDDDVDIRLSYRRSAGLERIKRAIRATGKRAKLKATVFSADQGGRTETQRFVLLTEDRSECERPTRTSLRVPPPSC